ncbi:methyltransferase domain-containing protein [Candidatus Woesearchaeota archaeon]|nr:methyltransferase domain-containing protein [Candidatus Woesearchaeota archaeon]
MPTPKVCAVDSIPIDISFPMHQGNSTSFIYLLIYRGGMGKKESESQGAYKDHVEQTIRSYDLNAEEYENRYRSVEEPFLDFLLKFARTANKGRILDIGAGTGNDSKLLKSRGFDVTCLELSEEMDKRCRAKGLKTINMDMREMHLPANSFDAVLAKESLLHLRKSEIPKVFEKIKMILKPGGHLGLIMREGDADHILKEDAYFPQRFYSRFRKHRLDRLLRQHFDVIYDRVFEHRNKFLFSYILKNKKF